MTMSITSTAPPPMYMVLLAWSDAFAAHLAAVLDTVGVRTRVLVHNLEVPFAGRRVKLRPVQVFREVVVQRLPRMW